MGTHAEGGRRWLLIRAGLGAVLTMALVSACGPEPANVKPSGTAPIDTTPIEATGQPGGGTGQPPNLTQAAPATTAPPPPAPPVPGPTLAPVPAYQIVVKVSTPSATHPCYPAGSIEIYGTGFPVTVTHEWRYRSVMNGTGDGSELGPAVTHGYNVEGGKAISSEKLPAGTWQVQLRVTSPKLIATEWVTHNPCSG